MKRTLWSLLVGAAAVLPAVHPGQTQAAPDATVPRAESAAKLDAVRREQPRVDLRRELRARRLDRPRAAAISSTVPPSPRIGSGPAVDLAAPAREPAPAAAVRHRLPPARAPDTLR